LLAAARWDITQPDRPQHLLLDEQLVGAQLQVIVNGDNYKNRGVTVSIAKIEESVSIQHVLYNVSKALSPEWVLPKNPNPMHNNGLLVVIKGEHCGKHIGQIHHRYHKYNGDI